MSISRNTTQIKHTMESMFLYVEQLILKEQQRQLQNEIPDKLCIINRAIIKILCNLYRMGETNQIELQERSKAIKSSVKVPTPNYHYTFKELFERFHGFLCAIMKHNGGDTASVCWKGILVKCLSIFRFSYSSFIWGKTQKKQMNKLQQKCSLSEISKYNFYLLYSELV